MKKIFVFCGIAIFLFGAICFAADFDEVYDSTEYVSHDMTDEEIKDEYNKFLGIENPVDKSVNTSVTGKFIEQAGENDEVEVKKSRAGYSEVPEAKRPKASLPEKIEQAAKKDESSETENEYRNTLKFGVATEISELIEKLNANDDPRFTDDLYDLFQTTRSIDVREKILSYFKTLEDPCLEDFAVNVLNDPFDEKKSIVKMCFQYISAVKCRDAVPAVLQIIENENEDYFNDALLTIGDIGDAGDAIFISELLDRDDFSDAQRQSLMKTLGKMHAVETWDKLVEVSENEDENLFVRMYAAEAIGAMEKAESIPILINLYENGDPNLRQYVIKGLAYFPEDDDAKNVIVQAVRDDHYKVRLEALDIVKKLELKDAMPFVIYRAKNDSEEKIKQTCYEVIALLNTDEGNDFLVERVTEKKGSNVLKTKAVEVLLKQGNAGVSEIKDLALQLVADDARKPLRSSVGKVIAKNPHDEFAEVCIKFLESKDNATQSLGLDMYQNGKYESAIPYLQKIADDKKANSSNKRRAKKMLGIEE